MELAGGFMHLRGSDDSVEVPKGSRTTWNAYETHACGCRPATLPLSLSACVSATKTPLLLQIQ